jgi:hypothetical protein
MPPGAPYAHEIFCPATDTSEWSSNPQTVYMFVTMPVGRFAAPASRVTRAGRAGPAATTRATGIARLQRRRYRAAGVNPRPFGQRGLGGH